MQRPIRLSIRLYACLLAAALVVFWLTNDKRDESQASPPEALANRNSEVDKVRVISQGHSHSGAAEAQRIATPQGQPDRIIHSDGTGQVPLEKVYTPKGWITIQRTFKTDGTLIKEEAFLDGKLVPIPPR